MNSHARRSAGRRWAPGLLLALTAVLAGCNPLGVVPVDSIRVQIQSAPGVSVHLLTSTDIRTVREGNSVNLDIVSADTEWRPVPFDSTFDIRGSRRFLVRVFETDVEGAEVEMRVWVDGVEEYHHTAVVTQTPLQYAFMGR